MNTVVLKWDQPKLQSRSERVAHLKAMIHKADQEALEDLRTHADAFLAACDEIANAETLGIGAREEARRLAEHVTGRMANLYALAGRR